METAYIRNVTIMQSGLIETVELVGQSLSGGTQIR